MKNGEFDETSSSTFGFISKKKISYLEKNVLFNCPGQAADVEKRSTC